MVEEVGQKDKRLSVSEWASARPFIRLPSRTIKIGTEKKYNDGMLLRWDVPHPA